MFHYLGQIRWKAVLAGLAVSVLLGAALGSIYMELIGYATKHWLSIPETGQGYNQQQITEVLQGYINSPRWFPGWVLLEVITQLLAGYATAHCAKKMEVLNGVVVGCIVGAGAMSWILSPIIIVSTLAGAIFKKRSGYAVI